MLRSCILCFFRDIPLAYISRTLPNSQIFRHFQDGSAQLVGFFKIWSGRVLENIAGSRSDPGRVEVLKHTIGYFQGSFYSRVFWALLGIFGYIGYHLFLGGSLVSQILNFVYHLLRAEKIAKIISHVWDGNTQNIR